MFQKLKEMREVRLGFAIAGGVFAGLLGYRMTTACWRWATSLSAVDLGSAAGDVAVLLICAFMLGGAGIFAWALTMRLGQFWRERRDLKLENYPPPRV